MTVGQNKKIRKQSALLKLPYRDTLLLTSKSILQLYTLIGVCIIELFLVYIALSINTDAF